MNAFLTQHRLLNLPLIFFENAVQSAHSTSPPLRGGREGSHTGKALIRPHLSFGEAGRGRTGPKRSFDLTSPLERLGEVKHGYSAHSTSPLLWRGWERSHTGQSAHSTSPLLWRACLAFSAELGEATHGHSAHSTSPSPACPELAKGERAGERSALRSILILILTCTTLLVQAQVKNDLRRQKLKGNVKSVTEYEYSAVPDAKEALKDGLRMKSVCKYNADGNRTEFITYSPDGKEQSKSVYNYNDSGRLVDVKRYRGDGGLNVTTTYTYDKLGNESEEHNYDPSGTMFMTGKGRYDLNGNRITYDRYDMTGHLFLKSNLRYDRNGNETEEREYDSHESLQFTTTFEYENYDKQGNWLWKATYKNDVPRTVVEREIEY